MIKKIYLFRLVLVLFSASVATISCRKEYASYPYNEILTFKITDSVELNASVVGNEILVYWPSFIPLPDSVSPGITVSEKASVSPSSRQKVAFKDGLSYTVVAENGDARNYTLKLVINQPYPTIDDSNPVNGYNGSMLNLLNYLLFNNLIPDTTQTRFFLVSEAGTEFRLPIEAISTTGLSVVISSDDGAIAPGVYKAKVTTGIRTAVSNNAFINVLPAIPVIDNLTAPVTVSRGGNITFTGKYFTERAVNTFRLRASTNSLVFLELAEVSENSITLRIPDDFPLGEATRIGLGYDNLSGGTSYLNMDLAFPVIITE